LSVRNHAPWSRRSTYLFLSLCQGTFRRMNGNDSKNTPRARSPRGPEMDGDFWGHPRVWVTVDTIQALGMESRREGFWPGLHSLKRKVGWEIVPFISLFLTPTITNLDFTLPRESNRRLQPSLSLLARACCQHQSSTMDVEVDVDTSDPLSGGEMGCLVSGSQHTLRRVQTGSFASPDTFPVITNLPQLQELILHESRGPNLPQFLKGLSARG
jgi:hypothetical protein